jgi:hypothetical protein
MATVYNVLFCHHLKGTLCDRSTARVGMHPEAFDTVYNTS